jgi:adenylate cyclase
VQCAVAVQEAIAKANSDRPAGEQMRFRIGIHVGDIIVQGDNLFGDGINIAARLEALAEAGGICVSGAVRDHIGTNLPVGFVDLGPQQVKNITQPIKAYRVRVETSLTATPVLRGSLPLPDTPSIAVLPFQNMSGDPEQEYFVDGMVEEIITALPRIRWLFVIARNSSFTYKGQSIDVKQLGVRYVLEGSVRKAGQRVRITGQLIDAVTGTHRWADRFDGSLEDVFELQDQVATSVAGVIEPTLQTAEIRRSTTPPTHDLTAYDLYLRALPHWSSFEKDRILQALDLLGLAIERDPHYGSTLALAAHSCQLLAVNDWADDPKTNRRKGLDLTSRTLRAGPDDPDVLASAGFVLGFFGEDIDVAIRLIERSLALNPSFARGWMLSGILRNIAGQPDLAIEHFETSLRLSPRDLIGNTGTGLGGAYFLSRQFEDAATILLSSLERAPAFAVTYRVLASCYAHMGRLDDAREIVERLRAITPVVMPRVTPFRNPEHRQLFLSGLRLAAGEVE